MRHDFFDEAVVDGGDGLGIVGNGDGDASHVGDDSGLRGQGKNREHDGGGQNRSASQAGGERPPLTETQAAFLDYLSYYRCLPAARFVTASSREEEFAVVSLAPVFIQTRGDTMERVREMGTLLTSLEEGGYLSVDYDLPLSGYGYEEFKESELYAYFCRTVEEASRRKGFLGDLPVLELGSIAPL